MPSAFPQKLIRIEDVIHITNLSKSQIYALIAEEKFVRQIKIGRSSRWSLEAVNAWVAAAESEAAN